MSDIAEKPFEVAKIASDFLVFSHDIRLSIMSNYRERE